MSSAVDVRPINSRRGWKDFYRVKCDLYRNDPAAVIPIRSMEYALLDDKKHPFYLHAQRQGFVAYQNGRPVGRIVAIKDDLHNEYYSDTTGFFGFFESPNDQRIANALLKSASGWLLDRGLDSMRGPVNPSMKSEFGVLVEGHEYPPYIMMAHTPKYYAQLLEDAGFEVLKRFLAFLFDAVGDAEDMANRLKLLDKFADRVAKKFPNVRIERATRENLEERIREINLLANEVRSEGWGFVPMTEEELAFMVSQVKRILKPETVIAAYVDDRMAAYNITAPDINWAVRKTRGPGWLRFLQLAFWLKRIPNGRCIAYGAAKDFRRTGVAMLVTRAMMEEVHYFKEWEFSWILEDNRLSIASLNRAVTSRDYKKYHLYERAIDENSFC